jgi:hypothetical protein
MAEYLINADTSESFGTRRTFTTSITFSNDGVH